MRKLLLTTLASLSTLSAPLILVSCKDKYFDDFVTQNTKLFNIKSINNNKIFEKNKTLFLSISSDEKELYEKKYNVKLFELFTRNYGKRLFTITISIDIYKKIGHSRNYDLIENGIHIFLHLIAVINLINQLIFYFEPK